MQLRHVVGYRKIIRLFVRKMDPTAQEVDLRVGLKGTTTDGHVVEDMQSKMRGKAHDPIA